MLPCYCFCFECICPESYDHYIKINSANDADGTEGNKLIFIPDIVNSFI